MGMLAKIRVGSYFLAIVFYDSRGKLREVEYFLGFYIIILYYVILKMATLKLKTS